jgi:cob(I)alamin adenosyltransferase
MRIYTRTGDRGETGLLGGPRVGKDHIRIETYGEIDELNAGIGFLGAAVTDPAIATLLQAIQNHLFEAGSELARPPGSLAGPGALREEDVAALEREIDRLQDELPPLTQFILPGGCEAASRAHLARCVCRRAERSLVRLLRAEPAETAILRYLNRLSDLLFVLARWLNRQAAASEVVWESRPPKSA